MSQESILAYLKAQREKKQKQRTTATKQLSGKLKKKGGIFPLLPAVAKQKAMAKVANAITEINPGGSRKFSVEKEVKAVTEHLLGSSQRQVEAKYGFSNGYINRILKHKFGNREQIDTLVEDLLLENAVVAGLVFQDKAKELSARDAAMSMAVLSRAHTEKLRAKAQPEVPIVPVQVVVKLEQTLEKLKQIQGKIIDVETETDHNDS